jgi:hypothetical protein
MYNMDISIFGFKLNLEILILIGVIYLILVGHLFCGCCNYNLMEGFDVSGNVDISGNPIKTQLQTNLSTDKTNLSTAKSNLATQVAAGGPTTSTSSTSTSTEGFTGANTNYGQSSPYDLTNDNSVNTSSWSAQNMTVVPGQPLSDGVKTFLAREPQPVPLPEGELFMFANTPFKPECCPNTYSNGSGCACMTSNQYNYLITRGSNNVPYSEY